MATAPEPLAPPNAMVADPAQASGRLVASAMTLALTLVALLVLTWAMASLRIKYARIFEDFDVALPTATVAILSIPNAIVLAASAVLIGLLVAKEFLMRDKGRCLAINLGVLVMIVIGGVAFLFLLYMPMVKLIQSVS